MRTHLNYKALQKKQFLYPISEALTKQFGINQFQNFWYIHCNIKVKLYNRIDNEMVFQMTM